MSWWSWLVLGLLLLSVEMFAIDAQFYLIFVGTGALIVGLSMGMGIDLAPWAQWLVFAVLSLTSMFALRRKLYAKLRGSGGDPGTDAVGRTIVIPLDLPPGASCRAEFRGSTWKAVNTGEVVVEAGSTAVIEIVDGLTLHVRAAR